MRIVNEWNHKGWKFTVFHHNMKYHVKVEDSRVEQSYKIQDIVGFDIKKLQSIMTTDEMTKRILLTFQSLHEAHRLLHEGFVEDEEEFDTII